MKELFQKNIKYFYNNLPHYYNLILNIKTRRFRIIDDNILDTHTSSFLYTNSISKDSKKFSTYPLNNSLWKKEYFYITPFKWEENEFFLTGKAINNLINIAYNQNSFKEKQFIFSDNFLPTTIIYGILAGKHIQNLVENFQFQSLFIYEPNPEFFAISLYFIDYEQLYSKLQNRLFLWIKGEIDYFAIEKFYYERVITSSFLNLSLTTYSHPLIEDAKNKFQEVRRVKLRGWGTFEDELKGIKNHSSNINKYPLLNPKKEDLKTPFCVVANGKSLEKSIDFIKQNKDSMIIISVGTAINPLLKENIHSDFHIEQERIELLQKILQKPFNEYQGYFIGASVVNSNVFKLAKKPLMFIREGFSLETFFNTLKFSSPIVGNSGVAFASLFSNEIYLCGMDLGFRLNEKKHSSNSFYDDKEDKASTGIKVKGNFSDDIYSDALLLSSKKKIEQLIKEYNTNIYNLSDGSYIQGSIPYNKNITLPKIDKEKIIKQILKNFNQKTNKEINLYLNNKVINEILNLNTSTHQKLTGMVDLFEDYILSSNNFVLNTLLKGSIFHILNNFYILSFKVENNQTLQKVLKKEINNLINRAISITKKHIK